MLREIALSQVRVGMHIHAFSGAWLDHAFWRAQFTIRTEEELRKVCTSGASGVWIDTCKGLDLDGESPRESASAPAEILVDFPNGEPPAVKRPSSLCETELAEAAKVCRDALPRISAIFSEARMGKAVDAETCGAIVDEITESVSKHPSALLSLLRLKRQDNYTFMHSLSVCALMVSLGRRLGWRGKELKNVGLGGLLHDVGKAKVPLEILNKPGKLTPEERTLIRQHTHFGCELLGIVNGLDPAVVDICLHHHEKIDGTGYLGLVGDQISVAAKMASVCDVYDALTSDRPYRHATNPAEALRQMAQWTGHIDQHILYALVSVIGIYPIGSIVRLQSGRIAVVVGQNSRTLLTPQVRVFFDTRSKSDVEPESIDLSSPACQDAIVGCEPAASWTDKELDRFWSPTLTTASAADRASEI